LSQHVACVGSHTSADRSGLEPPQIVPRRGGAIPRSSGLVLSRGASEFLAERHLATIATRRPDGSLHAVPVGFTVQQNEASAWVITSAGSIKIRNIRSGSRACLCQVDGRRWLSLEGPATVHTEPEIVAEAVRRYGQRYQAPRPNPLRVCIEVRIERVQGSV
jgi:PPOX class probable F420-dependent enzyme